MLGYIAKPILEFKAYTSNYDFESAYSNRLNLEKLIIT